MKDLFAFAAANARAQFPVVLPLRVVCSWCQKVLQEGAPNAMTSHSICAECSTQYLEDKSCER